jgi:hypothetical protein
MKKQKSKFLAVKPARSAVAALSALTAMVLLNPVASATPTDDAMAPLTESIFANTYVTGGANSTINGNVLAGTATTLGAGATVDGDLQYGTAITLGAGASATSSGLSTAVIIAEVQTDVANAQSVLNGLPSTPLLPGNIATHTTFKAGVYSVVGLKSVAAGVTITLDAENNADAEFIFNISSYLTFGANVKVEVINGGTNARVIWNATGGYISIGAGADIVGTVIAHSYVSTGEDSVVRGVSGETSVGGGPYFEICGGDVFSATSYVTVGENATVGGLKDCTPQDPSDPQLECYGEWFLLGSGLSFVQIWAPLPIGPSVDVVYLDQDGDVISELQDIQAYLSWDPTYTSVTQLFIHSVEGHPEPVRFVIYDSETFLLLCEGQLLDLLSL